MTNKNSKDYSKGNEDGIKYSSGVQYTIHLPEKYYVESIDFTGYDNYKESDAYIKEVNGVNYNTTQYVFPMKDSNGNYTVASHTVTLNEATTDSITFTPGNKQVVWAITLHGYIKNTEEEPILAGDANMDGTVTVTDVMVVVDEILGNKPSPFSMRNADISGDGRITVVDAMQIVDIILNMP